MRAPWLVRTSSLYFHKARALRHTSALLRYSTCSLRHRYERAQFTIPFLKEIKKLVPRALLSYISTWEFLRTLEKYEKHSPSARASPHFSPVLGNSRVLLELDKALSDFLNSLVIARSLVSFGVNNKNQNCACRADSCNFVVFGEFTHA